ncbi:Esterase/lipase [Pseudozyma hubeiensis]|nr:Esterase/lipase [Pseudozyma hubeiensis]
MSSLYQKVRSVSFDVLWRTALVRLPRAVPLSTLKWTSPEGPHPFVFQLPSRSKEYTIPLHVFVPQSLYDDAPADGAPVLVDFHGGGFYLGSCLEQAPFCAYMARTLDSIVISVDYRMGPFHSFPAAIEDGEDVLSAILDEDFPGYKPLREAVAARIQSEKAKIAKRGAAAIDEQHKEELQKGNIEQITVPTQSKSSTNPSSSSTAGSSRPAFDFDSTKVAVSGFSSGGNLALNLALDIRPPELETPWPSRFAPNYPTPIPLLLFYPSFDLRQLPSQRSRPEHMGLPSAFWTQVADSLAPTYAERDQTSHPRVSPGLASLDSLHPSARMFLVLCELDTLSEQSKQWVSKVQAHKRTEHLVVEDVANMKHGWTQMPDGWLSPEEKQAKEAVFTKATAFVDWAWNGAERQDKPESELVVPQKDTGEAQTADISPKEVV